MTENIFISRHIKDAYNLPVIVGVHQSSVLDEKFFSESKCDAVVLGEGELTVAELTKLFIDGRSCIEQIRGIVYPTTTGLVKTPDRS